MSEFTRFEQFTRVSDSHKSYTLDDDLVWMIGGKDSDLPLLIYATTLFDNSVPKCLEWVIDPHERKLLLACAIHDECLKRGFGALRASVEFYCAGRARKVSRYKMVLGFFSTWAWVAFKRLYKRVMT